MSTDSARVAANSTMGSANTGNGHADVHPAADAAAWRRFVDMRSHRKPFRIRAYDQPFIMHALDPPRGIWMLCVGHAGDALLRCNGLVVATFSSGDGAAILHTEGCPFERAANFIAALSSNILPSMSDTTRTDFEFDLARWVLSNFEP